LERSELCNVHILVPVSSVHRAFVSRVLLHGSLAAGTCLLSIALRETMACNAPKSTQNTHAFSVNYSVKSLRLVCVTSPQESCTPQTESPRMTICRMHVRLANRRAQSHFRKHEGHFRKHDDGSIDDSHRLPGAAPRHLAHHPGNEPRVQKTRQLCA
jgi:hypothetical protein